MCARCSYDQADKDGHKKLYQQIKDDIISCVVNFTRRTWQCVG
jgi:hypothetical protein